MTMRPLVRWLGIAIVVACFWTSERVVRKPERPNRVVVTYWEKWTKFEGEAMRAVVDEFNRSQDRIYVDYLSIAAVSSKTLLAASGGVPPDVAGLYDADVAQFADDNALIPLDDFCREAGIDSSRYIPAYWDICEYGGKVWALPTTPASTALHYNREMLRAAGLDPDRPPTTIEELIDYSDQLLVRDERGRIRKAGFLPQEPGWWNWAWGYMFGGRLWDGKDTITCDSPENVRAFEFVMKFSDLYGATDIQAFRQGFGAFSSPQNAFMSEKVAMVLQGVWMYNFITEVAPDLDWAVAPFPHPQDRPDLSEMTFVGLDVLGIPRGARHPKEAFEFIKFVQSQRGMELLCMGQRKHSPLVEVSEDFYKRHPNPYIRLFADLPRGPNAVAPPQFGIWPQYSQELAAAIEQVFLKQKTPQEALRDVRIRMQPKLDAYLKTLAQRNRDR
ncbi:MAG: ABC transporter substrate-binding protein [Chthonomonadaceae bacterium]|uniref:ABC type glycerol-3-phosphate transporter, substrate-binding protein n=1 Tax=Candidatus Nitrosymbiomonas proteolyticus TaxID=2608984 RepID=A0A809REV3_9BACT|nr:ABC type glycerol-3-phosphate transporter, substrate-binding protein [Candidatus Nitrosymbiomonas proteolyticus]GIK31340.1 MAG: hypothetical protein BroJett009_03320 [Armatimonadota bacterium]